MNLIKYLLAATLLLSISACDTTSGEIGEDLAVIEAFIFAGEPVDNIRVTSTVLFSSADTISSPINDAQLRLIKNDVTYALEARGVDGYYYYPGDDLTVDPGDHFILEMDYLGERATAETNVPPPPVSVTLDSTVMEVPSFEIGVGRPPRGGGPGGGPGGGFGDQLTVTWDNSNDLLHYVVINGLEEDHESIFPEFLGQRIRGFRFISEPNRDSFFEINLLILEGLGFHEAKVYRVNQEYADLYDNRTQDSRDLNEPPDNIDGALGIFSAFNSMSVPFEVKREE
ncbi:MAG: DUF4249 family protein [Rhodothermales bacterium]